MSDIPVGSPPVPPGRHAAPSGWYPDPTNTAQERYWDGWQWSRNTRAGEERQTAPGQPAPGQPAQGQPASGQPATGQGAPGPAGGPAPWGPPGDQRHDPQPPYSQSPYPQQPYTQQPPYYQQQQYPPQQAPYDQQPSAPHGQQPYSQQPYAQQPSYPQQQPYPPQPYPQQQPYSPQPYPQQQPYPPQPYPQPGATSPGRALTADGVPLAGWWWRALAMAIDGVILFLIAAVPSIPIYQKLFDAMSVVLGETFRAAQTGQPAPPMPTANELLSASDQLLLAVIGLVVGMLYHTLFLRFKGATPGKMICGLRVVPVEQGRHRDMLAWQTALIRAAIWVVPGAISYLVLFRLLDVLFPLWQPRRQALHDMAAKTQVVRIR